MHYVYRWSVCNHKKIRSLCKLCEGGTYCEHDKPYTRCRLCGGGSFEHDRIRSCSWGNFVEGDLQRSTYADKAAIHVVYVRVVQFVNTIVYVQYAKNVKEVLYASMIK